jgi:hypothetical protein
MMSREQAAAIKRQQLETGEFIGNRGSAETYKGNRGSAETLKLSSRLSTLADDLLSRYSTGTTLLELCATYNLSLTAIYNELERDEDFRRRYELARLHLGDVMDELAYLCVRDCSPANVELARLQSVTFQRRASRLNPMRYNDRRPAALIQNNVNIGVSSNGRIALFARLDTIAARMDDDPLRHNEAAE